MAVQPPRHRLPGASSDPCRSDTLASPPGSDHSRPAGSPARCRTSSYYGPPLRLARDARRFDISPAWHCWVGTAPALQVLAATGAAAIGEHNVALANSFLTALDQPPSNSAIVSVPADDAAVARLTAAGVRFGVRAGRVRVAFHLYSTADDVDMAIGALRGLSPLIVDPDVGGSGPAVG